MSTQWMRLCGKNRSFVWDLLGWIGTSIGFYLFFLAIRLVSTKINPKSSQNNWMKRPTVTTRTNKSHKCCSIIENHRKFFLCSMMLTNICGLSVGKKTKETKKTSRHWIDRNKQTNKQKRPFPTFNRMKFALIVEWLWHNFILNKISAPNVWSISSIAYQ